MDLHKIEELRKEYEALSDEQLIELVSQGANDFVEGVYDLIMNEFHRRGLEEKSDVDGEDSPTGVKVGEESGGAKSSDELIPLAIILNEEEYGQIISLIDGAKIEYCSDPLHLKGKEYPRLLMVSRGNIDKAIELLASLTTNSSILLWR